MLDSLKKEGKPVDCAGFLDDDSKKISIAQAEHYNDVLIAIADVVIRERLVKSLVTKELPFKSLVDGEVRLHDSVQLGKGCIVCPGVRMTVDITVGDFVIINLNATIGHDVKIGDYCSIMPSANISGNVILGKGVLVGSGATILQGLTIGNHATIGAGAVVTRSIPADVTVTGVPARTKK